MRYSYVTVITNDKYFPGLCSLVYSLKKVESSYPLTVVIPKSMDSKTKQLIHTLDILVVEADDISIDFSDISSVNNLTSRWVSTFFKLNIFNLTQFDKIVFLDSDMIIYRNIDDLFEKPHMSSVIAGRCAVKEWTELNSGLMVIVPNQNEYNRLISSIPSAYEKSKKEGNGFGDQDVIHYCFPNWFDMKELILSESYNVLSFYISEYSSAYGYDTMKVLHFAEAIKPWQYSRYKKFKHICSRILSGDILRLKIFTRYIYYIRKSMPKHL